MRIFIDGWDRRQSRSLRRALVGAFMLSLAVALSACGSTGGSGGNSVATDLIEPLAASLDTACAAVDDYSALAEPRWDALGAKDQQAVLIALSDFEVFCAPAYTPSALAVTVMTAHAVALTEIFHDKVIR